MQINYAFYKSKKTDSDLPSALWSESILIFVSESVSILIKFLRPLPTI